MAKIIDVRDLPFYSEWVSPDPVVTLHTSGSTGQPRPMLAGKKRMEASARATCSFLGLRRGDRALLCMSTEYVGGKMMVVRALTCGLELVCVEPSGHPLAGLEDMRFDLAAMVPLQVCGSMSVPAELDALRGIRHLLIGGGPVDDSLAASLRDFPNAVWSTYGMTETLSHIALRRLSGPEADGWYRPFPGVAVDVDSSSRLVIDAPGICAERVVTNDIAKLDAEGRGFRILGRADNVICSGGLKFSIEDIENRLSGHMPCGFIITRCPDVKFGQIVTALVDADCIGKCREVCDSLLPPYMRPRLYVRVERLPLTGSGKPARARAEAIASLCRDGE